MYCKVQINYYNSIVNADLNGAANILSKVARNLDLELSGLGRQRLTMIQKNVTKRFLQPCKKSQWWGKTQRLRMP
jgi:hypothetical protein